MLNRLKSSDNASSLKARKNTTHTRIWLSFIIGLAGAALVGFVALLFKGTANEYFYSVIWERGPVQFFELVFSFTVLGHIIQKLFIINYQRSFLENDIFEGYGVISGGQVEEAQTRLEGIDGFEKSILLQRVSGVLKQWKGHQDINVLSAFANAEADREFDLSNSTQAIARLLLNTIPLLGFIGTVLGLGGAVAEFSTFLQGALELSQITNALKDVTSQLGTAFDTTLLALVLLVIFSFPLTTMIRKEETMFNRFDSYVMDEVISRLPGEEGVTEAGVQRAVEAGFRRYIPDPDRYEEVFRNAVEQAAETLQQHFGRLQGQYGEVVTELTAKVGGSMEQAGHALSASMSSIVSDMQQRDEAFVENRRAIGVEELGQLKMWLSSFNGEVGELQKLSNDASAKVGESASLLADRLDQVKEAAEKIDELLHIQEATERSISSLQASSDFTETLRDLRKHLEETDTMCRHLQKPRVLTIREDNA